VSDALATQPNIIACEPLDYRELATVLTRCVLVITDSGGLQEEAPSLSIPVLVTRATTERGEGVVAGTLKLVGTDIDTIVREADHLLTHEDARLAISARENPYGDGRAARRIVDALESVTGHDTVPERFGPGFSRMAVLRAAGFGDDDVRQAMLALRMTPSESGS
jgi:UDP-N-acetylglucosamine 2-epimerase (non-hydrolysing)